MYYQPNSRYFSTEEFFSPTVFEKEDSTQIWRLIDWRVLYTINEMRNYFKKPIHINDWKWNGKFKQRGFRAFEELVSEDHYITESIVPSFSSFTSQHCFGRALDFDIEDMVAEEIREDIINNHGWAQRYQYITAIEKKVSWVHLDVRSWDLKKFGLLVF